VKKSGKPYLPQTSFKIETIWVSENFELLIAASFGQSAK
jgi:hypothetical protein